MNGRLHTILIVDDEPDIRELLAFIMADHGYQTVTAASCSEALAIVKDRVIDGILTDMKMPDGTGIDLLERLPPAEDSGRFVVVMSGYTDLSVDLVLAKGATAVIQKPIEADRLLEFIDAAVKNSCR